MKYNYNCQHKELYTINPMIEKDRRISIIIKDRGGDKIYEDVPQRVAIGSEFTQIYKEAVPVLRKLNNAGMEMFIYIFDNLKIGYNNIILKQNVIAEELGVSKSVVSKGITNLLVNRVIFKSKDAYTYVINHNYFFKGSRYEYEKDLKENIEEDDFHGNQMIESIYDEDETTE